MLIGKLDRINRITGRLFLNTLGIVYEYHWLGDYDIKFLVILLLFSYLWLDWSDFIQLKFTTFTKVMLFYACLQHHDNMSILIYRVSQKEVPPTFEKSLPKIQMCCSSNMYMAQKRITFLVYCKKMRLFKNPNFKIWAI